MNNFLLTLLKLLCVWLFAVALIAALSNSSYASHVPPHGELALVGYEYTSAHTAPIAVFLCVFSLCARISMVKLEGDAFARAGFLCCQSTNPFQLCHPYLVVNGKASESNTGAHTHA